MIFIGFSLILIILMLYVLKIYFNSVFITPPYDATKFIDELKYHYPSKGTHEIKRYCNVLVIGMMKCRMLL